MASHSGTWFNSIPCSSFLTAKHLNVHFLANMFQFFRFLKYNVSVQQIAISYYCGFLVTQLAAKTPKCVFLSEYVLCNVEFFICIFVVFLSVFVVFFVHICSIFCRLVFYVYVCCVFVYVCLVQVPVCSVLYRLVMFV